MKRGILLLNLGGPTQIKDVKPFLYNLFSDPDILVGIPSPFRQALAFFISRVKGVSSEKIYSKIGGCSPQLCWSNFQAQELEKLLNESSKEKVQHKVVVGMRAWTPYIGDALQTLRQWGATELVLLPFFPQFSTTTTGSCFKEVERCLKKMTWNVELKRVQNWPDHPAYTGLVEQTVQEALERAEKKFGKDAPMHVLFSAHSLPMKIIERGDPYPQDVQKTVQAVTKNLNKTWSLAFQSRNGSVPWLKPYTEDELQRLAKDGVKNVLVVPISFVSDHIETLYELDQLYADLAAKDGITHFSRTRSFNADPAFPKVLQGVLQHSGLC